MSIVLFGKSSRARLVAALALLAVLLGAVAAGPRLGAAASLFATTEDDGGRWFAERDESKPAIIERDQRGCVDEEGWGQAAPQHDVLAPAATKHTRPCVRQRAARPAPADPPRDAPAYRRPDPTGPPLLG